MTSAENTTHAEPLADRRGLAAVMAILAAMSRLIHDCKELPTPWNVGFTCHVPDRAALEHLHDLYGGKLHDTWLDLSPDALRPYLPVDVDPRTVYLALSVHIEKTGDEVPL